MARRSQLSINRPIAPTTQPRAHMQVALLQTRAWPTKISFIYDCILPPAGIPRSLLLGRACSTPGSNLPAAPPPRPLPNSIFDRHLRCWCARLRYATRLLVGLSSWTGEKTRWIESQAVVTRRRRGSSTTLSIQRLTSSNHSSCPAGFAVQPGIFEQQ